MNHHKPQKGSSHLIWPIAILFFLTVGVFLTTREVPRQHDTKSQAQTPDASSSALQTPEISPTEISIEMPKEDSSPVGAVIAFSFSLPGISSQAGNIKPQHTVRLVTLSFYDKDDNIADIRVKPVYQIQTQAVFDNNPASSTYTFFIQDGLDLGTQVPSGEYQIGLKTDQTLQKVIKNRENDLEGKIFTIVNNTSFSIGFQTLLVGDIVPSPKGDNKIDIADYNAFIDCFGLKQHSSDCVAKEGADFDDNGVVDGIDYNIMLRNFQTLLSLGFSLPSLAPSKSPVRLTPTLAVQPTIVKKSAKTMLNPLGITFAIIVLVWILISLGVFIKSKMVKSTKKQQKVQVILPSSQTNSQEIESKEYYIKKQTLTDDKKSMWVTLTDDNGQHLGHYNGIDVKEGFAHIKGVSKTENGKTFIEVSKIISDEKK